MSIAFMPIYVGDWDRDTAHLTTEEDGAYWRLVRHYWCHGNVPGDRDDQMARIVRLPVDAWLAMKPTIAAFFRPGWIHKRIEHELDKAATKIEKRRAAASEAGKKSGEVRKARAEQRRLREMKEYLEQNGLELAPASNETFAKRTNGSAERTTRSREPIVQIDERAVPDDERHVRAREPMPNQPEPDSFLSTETEESASLAVRGVPVENQRFPTGHGSTSTGSLATAPNEGALREPEQQPKTTRVPDNEWALQRVVERFFGDHEVPDMAKSLRKGGWA